MKKLSARGQKWLKAIHLFFAAMWTGAAVCLMLQQYFLDPGDGPALYGVLVSLKFIDDFVIIPGAMGLLLTGLNYSIWTNWGWFRHRWITVKWCITVYGIIFGTFWLGPWLNALPPLAQSAGLSASTAPLVLHNRAMLLGFGTFQALTIFFAVFISVLKPWKKKG
jgi:hypothetical protein